MFLMEIILDNGDWMDLAHSLRHSTKLGSPNNRFLVPNVYHLKSCKYSAYAIVYTQFVETTSPYYLFIYLLIFYIDNLCVYWTC